MSPNRPRWLAASAFMALMGLSSTASAQQVLLIWDTDQGCTPQLRAALQAAGMTVTMSQTDETAYNGANPAPGAFDAIIHLNGTTFGTGMSAAGQAALVNYVQNTGGGFIHGEWNAYEIEDTGAMTAMSELTLFRRSSGQPGPLTYTVVAAQAAHPVLQGLPNSFTFNAGSNIGAVRSFAQNPALVLMTEAGNDAVAVREVGQGRVVGFHHAGNWSGQNALCDANVQRLYVNAVNWAGLLPRGADTSATTAEDTATNITLSATDPLGGAITYAIVTPPASGTLTGAGASRTYTPNANFNGADSFRWSATNARGTRTFTVNITVTPVNDAPVTMNVMTTTNEDTFVDIPLVGADVDGDALTYSVVTAPPAAQGTVTITGGVARFTPAANFNGAASFTYRASDGTLSSNTSTVSITVTPVNDAPVANNVNAMTAEDTPATITLNGTDVDSMNLTYTIVAAPAAAQGTVSIMGNQAVFTPAANFTGVATFTYRVSDGALNSNTATVTVTVTPVNDAPVANNVNATTNEDTAVNVTLNGTDIDSMNLTYAIVAAPAAAQGTVSITGNVARFVPAANFNGTATFTYRVNDGSADSNVATVTVTVTPVNDAPVAQNQTVAAQEDTPATITLGASDVDGDMLTFSIVAAPLAAQGAVTIVGNQVVFTPAANFSGATSFTFRANDGALNSNTATVTINVAPVNDAPVAADGSGTTAEDTAVNITLSATDIDSMNLTYAIVTQPINGTVVITGNVARYTPNANFHGADTFTFRANDGSANSNVATVAVTVTPVNDAPVAADTSATTAEDTAVTLALPGSDVDGDALTPAVVAQPANGTVSIVGGQAVYTPNANFAGSDTFTFRVSDGQLDSNVATATITVTPTNDAPTVSDATLTVDEDTAGSVALNAADLDGDVLSAAVTTAPFNGTVTINGLDVTYTPEANFNGLDSFKVTVSDGNGGQATAIISVTINPINDAPVATAQSVNVDEDSAGTAITLAGTDVDGDTLTFTVVTQPTNGTLSGTAPDLTYIPNADFTGTDSFTFTVNDGTTDSAPATVDLTVAAVNDPPMFVDPTPTGPLMAAEGQALTFGLVAVDPDGDMLSFAAAALPAGATLDAASGAFSWTPTFDQEGTTSLEFTVTDGAGQDARTIDVVVTFTDADGDTLPDTWEAQNGLNPASPDSDGDTISDAFEVGDWRDPINTDGDDKLDAADTDSDGDGRSDADEAGDADLATAPVDTDMNGTPDFRQTDSDGDGVNDGMDNCPLVSNADQADANMDGIGDACQDDRDGDGVNDGMDNCPNVANGDQLDTNMNGQGDVCDADDDGDGAADDMDNCPLVANVDQLDTDMDGQGDACDTDDDNDQAADDMDSCPLVANADQVDTDMDGQGDACDLDDDGDGVNDDMDTCPLVSAPSGCPAPDDDKVVSGADDGCGCATVENDRRAPSSLLGLLAMSLLGLVGWRRRR